MMGFGQRGGEKTKEPFACGVGKKTGKLFQRDMIFKLASRGPCRFHFLYVAFVSSTTKFVVDGRRAPNR